MCGVHVYMVPTIYLQGEHSLLCYHAEVSLQKIRRNTIFRDVIRINFDQFNKLTNQRLYIEYPQMYETSRLKFPLSWISYTFLLHPFIFQKGELTNKFVCWITSRNQGIKINSTVSNKSMGWNKRTVQGGRSPNFNKRTLLNKHTGWKNAKFLINTQDGINTQCNFCQYIQY